MHREYHPRAVNSRLHRRKVPAANPSARPVLDMPFTQSLFIRGDDRNRENVGRYFSHAGCIYTVTYVELLP
jgi:hypothetical protein